MFPNSNGPNKMKALVAPSNSSTTSKTNNNNLPPNGRSSFWSIKQYSETGLPIYI
ncbi:hypothetical protein DDB_G0280279 [Dictyostelium discoideum AX4]|uniref:Uncharacterized protein DDB_G0280279 n=1 Tax=Dictyostelium discoideum TaxID=44689 RepID=Y0648_DICDI|nr:hypothetical protein DDB_G0280279 [Dictyostelium discoideum AX4]Q54VK6.2 RecName: Full=Uncharacterized protein DDB_G0280279 [Dictyostelium discoideum]EAL67366.2 hypothetical protein DDB_G0280279 [Dictyostelium discoideum AX4]|eukprot:XP_641349.2 hypothetical protein DDB_G0280279 [Dictyostelium discoideum AX4]